MRILVISDTHIQTKSGKLPPVIQNEASRSDYCLHCGDFTTYRIYEKLKFLTKTYGVCGNMDDDEVHEKLPSKCLIKIEQITLGLIHGGGSPNNLIYYINQEFSKNIDEIDIFVFGHSHLPVNEKIKDKIYFNPGSLTDKVSASYRSYGIIQINGRSINAKVVKIG